MRSNPLVTLSDSLPLWTRFLLWRGPRRTRPAGPGPRMGHIRTAVAVDLPTLPLRLWAGVSRHFSISTAQWPYISSFLVPGSGTRPKG